MFLQDYGFDLRFVPGKENVVAGTLSRADDLPDDCEINLLQVQQKVDWKQLQDDEETKRTLGENVK